MPIKGSIISLEDLASSLLYHTYGSLVQLHITNNIRTNDLSSL